MSKMRVNAVIHGGPRGWQEVVEGLIQRNVRAIREGKSRDLSVARPKYVRDNIWRDVPSAIEEGHASAGTMAAWHAAEQIVRGASATVGFLEGTPVVLLGRRGAQKLIDPSLALGRRASDHIGLVGEIPGETDRGVIRERMIITIDDPYALGVREVGSAIARHNTRLIREGWNIPPLYTSGIVYRAEGSPERWLDAPAMLDQGHDDCEGLSAYRAGEITAREDLYAGVWTRLVQNPDAFGGSGGGRTFHAVTRAVDRNGQEHFDDPSALLGMEVPRWYVKWAGSRRAQGQTLDWPPRDASGRVIQNADDSHTQRVSRSKVSYELV